VATEVGFFDQSHFGRHFKRCCGMTPSMFVERAAARKTMRGAPAGRQAMTADVNASGATMS
jgi:AraC-like DNA-binding protein